MQYGFSTSSGVKTDSAQISSLSGSLRGVDLIGPLTGTATLTIYDNKNADTSGLILAELIVDAGMPSLNHEYMSPVGVNSGIYCTLTYTGGGSGAQYVVRYALG